MPDPGSSTRSPRFLGWLGIVLNAVLYGTLKWFVAPEMAFLNRMAVCFGVVIVVLGAITLVRPMAKPVELPTTDLIDLKSSGSAKLLGLGVVGLAICLYVIFW